VRQHGRLNTCAGCLPKVTGVQRLPLVLDARQKSPPETAAEGKFLTSHLTKICFMVILQYIRTYSTIAMEQNVHTAPQH